MIQCTKYVYMEKEYDVLSHSAFLTACDCLPQTKRGGRIKIRKAFSLFVLLKRTIWSQNTQGEGSSNYTDGGAAVENCNRR